MIAAGRRAPEDARRSPEGQQSCQSAVTVGSAALRVWPVRKASDASRKPIGRPMSVVEVSGALSILRIAGWRSRVGRKAALHAVPGEPGLAPLALNLPGVVGSAGSTACAREFWKHSGTAKGVNWHSGVRARTVDGDGVFRSRTRSKQEAAADSFAGWCPANCLGLEPPVWPTLVIYPVLGWLPTSDCGTGRASTLMTFYHNSGMLGIAGLRFV